MSETDHVLGLVDDLVRLLEDSVATSIEVEADGFAVTVTKRGVHLSGVAAGAVEPAAADEDMTTPQTQTVHATTVGIFNAERAWAAGDRVTRGQVLGGIQSLGRITDLKAPADGALDAVLVATGAPVEYGQALFVIAIA